jgi:hypothetical protein
MLKTLCYAAAVASVAVISAGITAVVMQGQAGKSPVIPGFDHPNPLVIQQPTRLKKHELFSEDHTADVVAIQQVWAAYTFYNDAADGRGMASIFTEDGVDQHLWNDMPKLVPHYGINPTDTPMGKKGAGCVLRGRKEISWYFGGSRQKDPYPWPGRSHHETPSIAVKVSDDGRTAVMSAPYIIAGRNREGGSQCCGTGGYRAFFKKTSEGWLVAELYAIQDNPSTTPRCDLDGPLPRVPPDYTDY